MRLVLGANWQILLLTLGAIFSSQQTFAAEQGLGEYDFKTTLPILDDEFHTSCHVHSGNNLTMIHCSDQFEVYDTRTLEDQRSLITNYGDSRSIRGVHNSMKRKDRQSLTFLENNNVHKLYRDPQTGSVEVDTLMQLSLPSLDVATDLWVLDGIVAVRINDKNFKFFIEPLVVSVPVQPLGEPSEVEEDENDPSSDINETVQPQMDYTKLLAYSFAPMEEASNSQRSQNLTLFGVRSKVLVKIVYSLDEENMTMRESFTFQLAPNFNGTQMRIEVTEQFVIISNADGVKPGIYFYDHALNEIEFFPRFSLKEAPYNLEVHQDPDFGLLQVFIAGTNTLTIIEMVKNKAGENRFNLVNEAFIAAEEQPFASDQTYVAKSADYLVIKQSSKRTLGLMPICAYKFSYQSDKMECRKCEPGLRSYGLQSEECVTCMRAWLLGQGDEFRRAQYEQFCNDGHVFSIVLFAVVPVVTLAAAFVCCCCVSGNGIHGQQAICDDVDIKDKRVRNRQATRYVRRVSRRLEQEDEAYVRGQQELAATERKLQASYNSGGATNRVDTEAPIMTEGVDTHDENQLQRQPARNRVLDGDRYDDDQRSQDFSDTENEHYSAPGGIPTRNVRDVNVSVESAEARKDRSGFNIRDIRQTAKTNARPEKGNQDYDDDDSDDDYGVQMAK